MFTKATGLSGDRRGQRLMIDRRKRRSFAASRDIAERKSLVTGIPVSRASSAPLPSCTVSRDSWAMENRLPMETNDIDFMALYGALGEKLFESPAHANA